jgi:hypothetical protein
MAILCLNQVVLAGQKIGIAHIQNVTVRFSMAKSSWTGQLIDLFHIVVHSKVVNNLVVRCMKKDSDLINF